ncbi:MAG: hypothetical protein HQ522_01685 [Bacteroidetes bacterium]|nr:hypothetical protein [Bacteroidota bacterium]
MKQFSKYILLFSIPFSLGIGYLFLIPVNKNFSYHFVKGECDNKANWIYNRIFENKNSIDIAFSGASQTACAIMDELIETELNEYSDRELNIANLGYCRRGRDIQYSMLKDLFSNKKPSVLVIEVAEDEPKKSHPVFPYLASSRDLFGSSILFNQRYLSAIWKGIVVRFEYLKFRIFKTKSLISQDLGKYGYRLSLQTAPTNILEQNKAIWKSRLSNTKSVFARKIELNYSKHYLEKIVTLANKNNCKVLFLYLPESGSNLKLPLLADYYKELSELIVLPDSIIKDKSNWKDATHLNDSGAILASKFIVSVLSEIQ